MFKSKSNLKHFINLLHFFLKNYFFCRKSILDSADGPWLKSIFFYSNGFLFWLRKKIMEHLSVLADIYSTVYAQQYIFFIRRCHNITRYFTFKNPHYCETSWEKPFALFWTMLICEKYGIHSYIVLVSIYKIFFKFCCSKQIPSKTYPNRYSIKIIHQKMQKI